MFKKILGAIVMILAFVMGLFMIVSAKYLGWIAIINKEFVDFWVAFACTAAGSILMIGGFIISYDFLEEKEKDNYNEAKDLLKKANDLADKVKKLDE